MRIPLAAAGALLAAAWLAGCAAMTPAADPPPLEGTAWVLATLPGGDPVDGVAATLRFEQGRASGSDGCNRYTAAYQSRGGRLEVAAATAASTRMACPPAVMRQAAAFMAALGDVTSYRVEAGRLILSSADGAVRATLASQSQALAGTRWHAAGINNGKGAVVSLVAGSSVSLAFGEDGQATGSAGCNRYSAPYAQQGAQLRFQPAAATRRMCAGEDLMAQEQAFLKALESVATMRLEGPRLELRTAAGALAVSLFRDDG
jgi:heat shock protein HslJ